MQLKQNHIPTYIACALLGVTFLSGLILSHSAHTAKADTQTANATVHVPAGTCLLSGVVHSEHVATVANGTEELDIGTTALTVVCGNSTSAIYAVGYSNDTWKNTNLISSNSNDAIPTGTGTVSSNWSMKLTSPNPSSPVIRNDATYNFTNYERVPNDYALVATFNSGTSSAPNSTFTSTYRVYVDENQAPGTYIGKVRYTLVYPNDATPPIADDTLYDKVAKMSKGTQSVAALKATITEPTSSDPSTDTSNSGVYEYNASVFGASSDAANDYTIYYYRGILDSNLDNTSSTYGSGGDGAYYPNYVKLGNTCWRIIRTTGSGGVKMIYNGTYGATTSGSCANLGDNVRFYRSSIRRRWGQSHVYTPFSVVEIGYSYNAYCDVTDEEGERDCSLNDLFTASSPQTSSRPKTLIEENFSSINSYIGILESSAGYCNDRSVYSFTYPLPDTDQWPGNTLVRVPDYSSPQRDKFLFGAAARNNTASGIPKLGCPRSNDDVFTTSNAADGNGLLAEPAALVTADELTFAGNGASGNYAYNKNSFLTAGENYWTMSPHSRGDNNYMFMAVLSPSGDIDTCVIYNGSDNSHPCNAAVRPVISLQSGVIPASGSGTATDPWVVNAP